MRRMLCAKASGTHTATFSRLANAGSLHNPRADGPASGLIGAVFLGSGSASEAPPDGPGPIQRRFRCDGAPTPCPPRRACASVPRRARPSIPSLACPSVPSRACPASPIWRIAGLDSSTSPGCDVAELSAAFEGTGRGRGVVRAGGSGRGEVREAFFDTEAGPDRKVLCHYRQYVVPPHTLSVMGC